MPDAPVAPVTIATILAEIGTVFTRCIGWVGTVADTVTDSPILLLACVGVPLCGLGVGMFSRLIRARL